MKTILGGVTMVGLVVMFGCFQQPTEMGIIVVAGAICLCFFNLDKIQEFKSSLFEAKMKNVVDEANATIDQLRSVAVTLADVVLTDCMSGNFISGTTLENRLVMHDAINSRLIEIGATKEQIDKANEMWDKGIAVIFHSKIFTAIEGRKPHIK